MRKPNGFGSIKRLSGNRRRPYVYVISRQDGKREAVAYFTNQTEAEIFQIEYVKEHHHRSLPGHKITFAELFYRWLPVHIADIEPAQSTIDNYHNSFRHCVALQEMPVAELKFMHFQQVIDAMKKERLSYSSVKKVRSMISLVLNYGIEYEVVSVNYASSSVEITFPVSFITAYTALGISSGNTAVWVSYDSSSKIRLIKNANTGSWLYWLAIGK